ncbi:MAG: bifunctional transcriptional activator/DNA repair enzyme AdaA [Betaproteobacteria bacterium]
MTEEHWQAIVSCDGRYDGQFVYGVTTTGVFCRPSCRSKTPLRQNVRVFGSVREALGAGFRPCKRCRPDRPGEPSPEDSLVGEALRLISVHFAEDLTLRELAARLFVSPFHLQRVFKRVVGFSPAQYLTRQRIEAARALLADSGLSITAVALSVGFKNPAHFSAVFHRAVGCPPSAYRSPQPPHPKGEAPVAAEVRSGWLGA